MSHVPIIDRWPSLSAFAADIAVPYGTAKQMRRRGSVPSAYWKQAVLAAQRRGIDDLTIESFAEAVPPRRRRTAAEEAA